MDHKILESHAHSWNRSIPRFSGASASVSAICRLTDPSFQNLPVFTGGEVMGPRSGSYMTDVDVTEWCSEGLYWWDLRHFWKLRGWKENINISDDLGRKNMYIYIYFCLNWNNIWINDLMSSLQFQLEMNICGDGTWKQKMQEDSEVTALSKTTLN